MTRARRSRVVAALAAAAAAAAAAGLSGCASAQPGSAAVVGEERIAESAIADQVREVNQSVGLPQDAPNANLTTTLVSYNVLYSLVHQAAAAAGVTVPPGAVDRTYDDVVKQSGGEDQLAQLAGRQGIPPSNIRRDLEVQLLAAALANKFAPGTDQNAQQQAIMTQLGTYSESIGVEVAPKYGVWDPSKLSVGPNPRAVSQPAEGQLLPGGLDPQSQDPQGQQAPQQQGQQAPQQQGQQAPQQQGQQAPQQQGQQGQ